MRAPCRLPISIALLLVGPVAGALPPEVYRLREPPAGAAAIPSTVHVVADYGSFRVAELTREQANDLADDGWLLQDLDAHHLHLGSGWSWDTRTPEPPIPDDLRGIPGLAGLYLVQLAGPAGNGWLESLERLGARPIPSAVFPRFARLYWIESRDVLEAVDAMPFVRWTGVYHPAFKSRLVLEPPDGDAGTLRLSARVVSDPLLPRVVEQLEALGLPVERVVPAVHHLASPGLVLEVAPERLGDVLRRPGIWWVEEIGPVGLAGETARELIQRGVGDGCAGLATEVPVWAAGITGAGPSPRADGILGSEQLVGILDTTFNSPDFSCGSDVPNDTFFEYVDGSGCDLSNSVATCLSGHSHGSGTAGILAGNGAQSGGESPVEVCSKKGSAFGARLWALKCDAGAGDLACLGTCGGPVALGGFFEASFADGSRLSNHSWTSSGNGIYNAYSEQMDLWAWDNDEDPENGPQQEYLWIVAGGNSGPGVNTVSAPGTAKNDLTVAAVYNGVDGSCATGDVPPCDETKIVSYSSRGPTDDGRVGADLAAPSQYVETPKNGSGYQNFIGTSAAAPSVAGLAALVRDWLQNVQGISAPGAALVKALLLGSGDYVPSSGPTSGESLPGTAQGWGRANLKSLCSDWSLPGCGARKSLWLEDAFSSTGESRDLLVEVVSSSNELRCHLAWMDPPNLAGGGALVHDLDLRVLAPNATEYTGNDFSGAFSDPGGGVTDTVEASEGVRIAAPTPGLWTVRAEAADVAGVQPWAVACNGRIAVPEIFTIAVEPEEASVCAGDDAVFTVDVGQLGGYGEPVDLGASGSPGSAVFVPDPVNPPGLSVLTIDGLAPEDAGIWDVTVTGEGPDPDQQGATLQRDDGAELTVFADVPGAPTAALPPDGATDVSFRPTFEWLPSAGAVDYLLEVATDPGFTTVVDSVVTAGTSTEGTGILAADTEHWWRVTASNACGDGLASAASSFTVRSASLACDGAAVDFEGGIPLDWEVVDGSAGQGIVWRTTADPACDPSNGTNGSGEAACADRNAAGPVAPPFDARLVSPAVDLGSALAVQLTAAADYRDLSPGDDLFEVDLWTGSAWTNLLTWDESHEPEDLSLDLGDALGVADARIRFRYRGTGYAWFAQIDDVALACQEAEIFSDGFESGDASSWTIAP